jgi:TRAP-type C4-dicarboxylate transport system permease small subunit
MIGRERIVVVINSVAAILLAATVAMMTVQLFRRTVMNAPMTWAEEMVRYCFVWAVYLGSVLALIRDSHIRVLVVVERFGKTGRVWSDRLTWLVNVIAFAYLFYWSVDLAWQYRAAEFYTLPGVPQVIFYLSVPVSTAIILFFLLFPDRASPHHDLPPPEL